MLTRFKICIVTPAPPGSLHGNRFTALRWANFLNKLGHQITIQENWHHQACDVLIALHALRSHHAIQAFKTAFPNKPVILILTGTDLYRDLESHPEVLLSMAMADQIVTLQAQALELIPLKYRSKASVIYQSMPALKRQCPPKNSFLVSIIGHLRPEKDPFCFVRALPSIPTQSRLRVVHIGQAMDQDMAIQAQDAVSSEKRYQWLGKLTHAQTMRWLTRSHLMVISSLMEGGAHVVSEAASIGIPILASKIAGNIGLLGSDYDGYFPVQH
ncbi:MAG: TIGR04348 family glycosyltransferase, partial [Polynucleobacter sp.]|nr:TIGR04348 family glycosyltransferase [Polynucleobacter sp.]